MLCGNSGGGSLYTFYLHQALTPAGERLHDTAAGDPFDLGTFELPAPDAMVYLAAHVGEGHYLLSAIDPSVIDESDPTGVRSRASTCTTRRTASSNRRARRGTRPSSSARYREAQRARVARIDAEARRRHAIRRDARAAADRGTGGLDARRRSIATDFMCVYRTDADPRGVDLTLDPSRRDYGSLWGVRPDWINYGAVGFGRVVAPGGVALDVVGAVVARQHPRDRRAYDPPGVHGELHGRPRHLPVGSRRDRRRRSPPSGSRRVDVDADHYGFPASEGREVAIAADRRLARSSARVDTTVRQDAT